MDTCPPNIMSTVRAHNYNSKRATKAINDFVSLGFNFKLENLEQRTLICREGNGKKGNKTQVGSGISVAKIQLGMGKN